MFKYLISFVSLVLLLSCQEDSLLMDSTKTINQRSEVSAGQTKADNMVVFKAVYDTKMSFDNNGMINISGNGFGTYLGWSEISAIHTTPDPYFYGTIEFSGKDEDKLYGNLSGISSIPDEQGNVIFKGEIIITDGNGKFSNSNGHLKIKGKANLVSGIGKVYYNGEISEPDYIW